ncbi:MAG: DMT family transporter [Tissierellaceae bacterium]|nr:DMT family transporter [Tissierellaceae bacterium]
MNKELRSSLLLLITAMIWGFAFVAQRVGMEHVEAFTYNGIRFGLGSLSLIPVIKIFSKPEDKSNNEMEDNNKQIIKYGIIAGSVLFIAATLQQIGLMYTTAAKAGFITTLYIVIVPILGLFLKQKTSANIWIGAIVATIGLYFLSINEDLTIGFGDLLQLIGSVFWAIHIILIGFFTKRVDSLKLSSAQFATCSVLSFIAAFLFEDIQISNIIKAIIPILYGGFMSVGIAYTLQAVAQKYAKASHAAIAMSMESVFAAIGGMLILGERLPAKGLLGCILMLFGMLISQADNFNIKALNHITSNSIK